MEENTEILVETEIEKLEAYQGDLQNRYFDWVSGEFRVRLGTLLSQNQTRKRDIELAELGSEFSKALNTFVATSGHSNWTSKLTETVFGRNKESVVNCLGQEGRERVKNSLIGPISTLTFIDLVSLARSDVKDKIGLKEILVPGEIDVRDKVDLIVELGDKGRGGKSIIRLVQLKTTPNNDARLIRVEEDNVKRSYFGKVTGKSAKAMLSLSDKISRNEDVKARCFVALIPAFDARVVGNIFGLVKQDHPDAEYLIKYFKEDAEREGFFPRAN